MKISVLMPTWNRGHCIRGAIQSILDQTYSNWELVIIDDGSVDDTEQAVKWFKDKRIRYFKTEHQGITKALNFGNSQCRGEIIVKQDSDDASLPNRLEVIAKNMKTDLFYHSYYHVFLGPNDTVCRKYRKALPIEEKRLLKEHYVSGVFAYTKKFSQEVPYRDLVCLDDWMLILDAVFKKKSIGFIDEGLYEYLLHKDSNSLISKNTGAYQSDTKIVKQILKDEYGKNFKYT